MSVRLETDLRVSLKPLQIIQGIDNYLELDLVPTTSRPFDYSHEWHMALKFQVSDTNEDQALTTNKNLGFIFGDDDTEIHQFEKGVGSIKPMLEYGKISRCRIGPVTTDFNPGPTLFQVNPVGFNEYEPIGFLFTLDKVARVKIDRFSHDSSKRGTFELTWKISGPVKKLLLSTDKGLYEVTGQTNYEIIVKKTQKVSLEAFGEDSRNRDEKEEILSVSRLLSKDVEMVVDPPRIDPENLNNWAIYLSTISKIELGDSFRLDVLINQQEVKKVDKREIEEWTPAKPIELFLEGIAFENQGISGLSPRLIVHIKGLVDYEDQQLFQMLKVKIPRRETAILEFYTDPKSPSYTEIDPSSKKACAVVDIFWRVFGAQRGTISFTKGFVNLLSESENEERDYAIEERELEEGSLKTKLFHGQSISLSAISDSVVYQRIDLPFRSIPISEIGLFYNSMFQASFNGALNNGYRITFSWDILTNCHLIPVFNHPIDFFLKTEKNEYVRIDQKNGYPSNLKIEGFLSIPRKNFKVRDYEPPLSFKLRSVLSDEDFYESQDWIPLIK